MKRTKQIAGILLSLILLLGIFPPVQVQASGKVTISVSASSVDIGDTVTITARAAGPGGEEAIAKLGFNYDSGKFSFVSCSESTYSGGGGGYVGVVSSSASITLKATAAGSASVSVSGSDGVNINDETAEYGELSAGGTTLTVNNAASANSGNQNTQNSNQTETDAGTGDTANKSGDNSLSSLSISPGTLSPAFKYSTTSYTASVGEDVTSIAVDAKPSNANATVESVSGNTDLKAGQNTISIVVKAENGTTATYKIVVTRGGAAATEETTKETTEASEETEETGENQEGITLNGHPFNLAPAIPADIIPQDFTRTTVTYQGQQAEGLQFDKATLTLVYLTTPDKDVKNTLAVYDEASGKFSQFRKVQLGETNYLILLEPPAETGLSQEYTQTTQAIGGYENVPAFVKAADAAAAQQGVEGTEEDTGESQEGTEENNNAGGIEFSLVYAVSSFGNTGWYQYDVMEETFQRYVPVETVSQEVTETEEPQEETSVEMQGLQNAYKELEAQYNKKKEVSRKTTAVMIFIIAVLVIVVVNLILRGKRGDEEEIEEENIYQDSKSRRRRRDPETIHEEQEPRVRKRAQMEHREPKDPWGEGTAPGRTISQETRPMYKTEKKPEQGKMSPGEEQRRPSPEAEQRRPSPGAEQRRPSPGTEQRRPSPEAEQRRPSPGAEQRRPSPGTEPGIQKNTVMSEKPDDDFEVIDLEDL